MFHKYVSEADLTKSHETEGDEKEIKTAHPRILMQKITILLKYF